MSHSEARAARALATAKWMLDDGPRAAPPPADSCGNLTVTAHARQRMLDSRHIPSFLLRQAVSPQAAQAVAGSSTPAALLAAAVTQLGSSSSTADPWLAWPAKPPAERDDATAHASSVLLPNSRGVLGRPLVVPAASSSSSSSSSPAGGLSASAQPSCNRSGGVSPATAAHSGTGSPTAGKLSTSTAAADKALLHLRKMQASIAGGKPGASCGGMQDSGCSSTPAQDTLDVFATGAAESPTSSAGTPSGVPRLQLPSPFGRSNHSSTSKAPAAASAGSTAHVRFQQAPSPDDDGGSAAAGDGSWRGTGAIKRSQSAAAALCGTAASAASGAMQRSKSVAALLGSQGNAVDGAKPAGESEDALDSLGLVDEFVLRHAPLTFMEQRGFVQSPLTYRAKAQQLDAARYVGTIVTKQRQGLRRAQQPSLVRAVAEPLPRVLRPAQD